MHSAAKMLLFIFFIGYASAQTNTGSAKSGEIARFDGFADAYTNNGTLRLSIREAVVATPSSQPYRALILYDPSRHLFSWHAFGDPGQKVPKPQQMPLFVNNGAAYVDDGHLVGFMAGFAPVRLMVVDGDAHASSLNEAEDKILELLSKAGKPQSNPNAMQPTHIIALPTLGLFRMETIALSSQTRARLRISSVTSSELTWL
jgi:hypothetical protein